MSQPKHTVSFSGGKDSTAMLLMMIEKGMQIDSVICIDTTKEFPQMYEHIKKVQSMIPIEIQTVKIPFDYYFGEHIKTKGKAGEVGYGWPNFLNRWCTALKRDTKKKFKGKYDIDYHGIAFDEKKRMLKNNTGETFQYPLIEWGITEKQALQYCYSKGLDWGGLYEKFNRVSCWCCPLQRINEFRVLYNDFTELWKQLEEMDKLTFRMIKKPYSVEDLKSKFVNENAQLSLWEPKRQEYRNEGPDLNNRSHPVPVSR